MLLLLLGIVLLLLVVTVVMVILGLLVVLVQLVEYDLLGLLDVRSRSDQFCPVHLTLLWLA